MAIKHHVHSHSCTHYQGQCDQLVCPREEAERSEDRRLARQNDDALRHQSDGRWLFDESGK